MEISKNLNNGILEVRLAGNFTFSDHLNFRDILAKFSDENVNKVIFNLTGMAFIDSSAIGMLLLTKDESKKHNKEVILSGATGQVKKMIELAKLDAMFIVK